MRSVDKFNHNNLQNNSLDYPLSTFIGFFVIIKKKNWSLRIMIKVHNSLIMWNRWEMKMGVRSYRSKNRKRGEEDPDWDKAAVVQTILVTTTPLVLLREESNLLLHYDKRGSFRGQQPIFISDCKLQYSYS
jgi:hypothetical protein